MNVSEAKKIRYFWYTTFECKLCGLFVSNLISGIKLMEAKKTLLNKANLMTYDQDWFRNSDENI